MHVAGEALEQLRGLSPLFGEAMTMLLRLRRAQELTGGVEGSLGRIARDPPPGCKRIQIERLPCRRWHLGAPSFEHPPTRDDLGVRLILSDGARTCNAAPRFRRERAERRGGVPDRPLNKGVS